MASFSPFFYSFLGLCLVIILSNLAESQSNSQQTHTFQLSSFKPSSICSPSSKGAKQGSSLKVVHKHGPCSHFRRGSRHVSTAKIAEEILRQDITRAELIQSRISGESRFEAAEATTLPARPGSELGSGNYYVTVGLGTPKKDFSLIFDTGSDLTWTQCQPCAGSCFRQKDPIFDPSASNSYSNQTCSSQSCSSLRTSSAGTCSDPSSTCIYRVRYGDGSVTEGYLAKETLTLTPSDTIQDFLFGCGQNNAGLFEGISGLLGLGRDPVSIVEQAAGKYNRLFSYCIATTSSSTGHLTLGAAKAAEINTPMLTLGQRASFYALTIAQISVGGNSLPAETAAELRSATSIIDSGTVITRLPSATYQALSSEFKRGMTDYPAAAGSSSGLLDTCFDFSGAPNRTISIPKINIVYGGEATVELRPENILFFTGETTACLAFAAGNSMALVGNVQQKGFDVVYDIGGARIGFTPNAC